MYAYNSFITLHFSEVLSLTMNVYDIISLQANNLHWKCLTTLSRVYDTPLWDCICDTLDVITEGVRVSIIIN